MIAYFLPFILYVGLPYFLSLFLRDPYTAYASRVLITLPVLIFFLKQYSEIKPRWSGWGLGLGVLIFILWVGLDPYYPKLFSDSSVSLDPTPLFLPTLALKFVGMVVVAPWVEEIFFRSFLPRYLQGGSDWKNLAPGTFTLVTFMVTAVIFGFIHSQWLPGILMGFLMNWIFIKTKNLWHCIVAHAVVIMIVRT